MDLKETGLMTDYRNLNICQGLL